MAPSQHTNWASSSARLVNIADQIRLTSVVHMVAAPYGKSAEHSSKPGQGDNGSGMHCNSRSGRTAADLRRRAMTDLVGERALLYIGGIIKACPAINAFTTRRANTTSG